MADNRTISQAEAAVRRLAELNASAFHLCDWGRRQGLHNRIPWRERLAQLPPDAVPVAGPAADIPAVPVVADSAGEYDAGSADASRSSQGRTDKALSQRRSGDRCGR